MKQIYTFLAGTLIILSSCSSSRKAAQTPDDIYYSPSSSGKAAPASNGGDQDEYYSGKAQPGDYYSTAPNDQYVRMKVQDPSRWSYFDDYSAADSYYSPSLSLGMGYGYGFPSYGYGLGFGFGPSFGLGFGDPYMCWNSYYMWNSWYNPYFYNPYYGGGLIVAGGGKYGAYGTNAVYSRLRAFNGTSYRNGLVTRTTSNSNERAYRPWTSTSYYTQGARNGNSRQINGNSNNFNNNNYRTNSNNNNFYRPSNTNSGGFSQPTRSYTPSSGGGGGGGGFSRPGRH